MKKYGGGGGRALKVNSIFLWGVGVEGGWLFFFFFQSSGQLAFVNFFAGDGPSK